MSTDEKLDFISDRLLSDSEQGDSEDSEDTEDDDKSSALLVDESEESECEDKDENGHDEANYEWSDSVMIHEPWTFEDNQFGVDLQLLVGCTEPVDFYELFMTDIWDMIVNETNRYGKEKDQSWELTTVEEMKMFVGLCLQIGIVKLPRLNDYWSNNPAFACHSVGSQVMPKDRFEKLMANLHFADNASYNGQDNLYKIRPLIELVNRNCRGVYRPARDVCIDVFLVPFTGRVACHRYMPNKRNTHGVILFKLCTKGGYTYRTIVCASNDISRKGDEAESIVVSLMEDLLDDGRHVYTDNWYTRISLAESLLQRKTHLIGPCKKDTKGLPKKVVQQKLRRGQSIAQQNRNGVMVLKWKERTDDIIMMSTFHDTTPCANSKRPLVLENYNQGKRNMSSGDPAVYAPYIRKASKWYEISSFIVKAIFFYSYFRYVRLFFHMVTQTCLVNAWRIYCDNVKKITMNDFKIQVYSSFLKDVSARRPSFSHILEEIGPVSQKRRRCVGCYKKLLQYLDSRAASVRTKQVNTRCSKCRKHFCLDCFNIVHQKCDL